MCQTGFAHYVCSQVVYMRGELGRLGAELEKDIVFIEGEMELGNGALVKSTSCMKTEGGQVPVPN